MASFTSTLAVAIVGHYTSTSELRMRRGPAYFCRPLHLFIASLVSFSAAGLGVAAEIAPGHVVVVVDVVVAPFSSAKSRRRSSSARSASPRE